VRSLEQGRAGLNCRSGETALDELDDAQLLDHVAIATPERIFELEAALRRGIPVATVVARTASIRGSSSRSADQRRASADYRWRRTDAGRTDAGRTDAGRTDAGQS